MTIKAIETYYNRYSFRSRLEARWAVFFDAIKVGWAYEPTNFRTMAGPYLPDFQLINDSNKVFVEIKPGWPSAQEQNRCIGLAQLQRDAIIFFCCGSPGAETIMPVVFREEYQTHMLSTWNDGNHSFWMKLIQCDEMAVTLAYHQASTAEF